MPFLAKHIIFKKGVIMRRKNIFKEIKRISSQFIETEYWYRFRKFPGFWYDDEENIYSPLKETIPARNWLTCTWDGENDILNIMQLKIEHMFWNLKKYGCHAYFYLDSINLESEYRQNIPEADLQWAVENIFERYFSGIKPEYSGWNHSFTEDYTDTRNWKSKLWIGNTYTKEYDRADVDTTINDYEHHSDSGICHYYLICEGISSLKTHSIIKQSFYIAHETDIQIPADRIPKNKKLYVFDKDDFLNGIHREAPQYRSTGVTKDFTLPSDFGRSPVRDLSNLQELFNKNKIPIKNLTDEILSGVQTFDIPLPEYIKLTPETQALVRGKRRTLTQLLHLRHLIKNIQKIDCTNKKYTAIYRDDKNLNQKERRLAFDKATQEYKKDRQSAYRALADFMAEYGDSWWD